MNALLLVLLLRIELPLVDVSAVSNALREQHFAVALELADRSIAVNGKDPRVWTLRGLAHAGLQQQAEGLKDLRHAVALAPDYLPALKAEAQLEYEIHDARSRKTLERVLALEPDDAVSHAMLGAVDYQGHNCSGVVKHYTESKRVIESQAPALTQFGQCLFQEGQSAQAREAFNKVIALDPGSWQARYNLALAHLLANQAGEALRTLEGTLTLRDAPSAQILDLTASAYEALGDTPRAVETLRQAILSSPAESTLYLHFADLSFAHNSFQAGIAMLNAGFQKIPHAADLYLARGILYVQLGEYGRAESDFAEAARLDPTQAFSSVAEGLSQLQRSNLDGALATMREQLRQTPNDGFLQYLKAEALRQKGVEPGTPAFREALTAVQTAIRLKPKFALAEDLLGTFYLRQNRLNEASRQFERTLQIEPDSETALYHLIVATKKSGRAAEVPGLMKRLSAAKMRQKSLDLAKSRYTFVEAAGKAQ